MNCKGGLILGTLLLAAVAHGQEPRLSCPLSYDPVVDPDSGLPFYNECLARLQLPSETKIVRRSALEQLSSATAAITTGARRLRATSSSSSLASAPSAADYLKLLPKPAPGAQGGDDVFVDLDIVTKYASEGFVYVGRPGFLPPADSATDSAATAPDACRHTPSTPAPASVDGSRVSLRIAYPLGDLYIKIWSAAELQRITALHTAATTATATSTPAAEGDEDLHSGTAALAAASTQQRAARRLLAAGGNSNGNSNGAGGGKNNGAATGPARIEITANNLTRPYSSVAYINITRYVGSTTWCTGAMAGPTSRLVLTAAHCVYEYDPVTGSRGYNTFVVIPGQVRNTTSGAVAMPYGRVSTNMAEVMAQWMLKGNFDFDIGLIRLAVHATLAGRAPGFMPISYSCQKVKSLALVSAGYASDKGFAGSMWAQSLATSAAQCGGSVSQKIAFSFSAGQDGSPLWSPADNTLRFVVSKPGLAVPINQENFAWIQDFTNRNIISLTPLQLQGGTSSPALFFKCDNVTKKCAGSNKAAATSWFFHPISVARKWALRYPGANLCLTANSTAPSISAAAATVDAYLAPCNTDGKFTFPPSQLWNVDTFADVGSLPAAKTDNEGYLSCAGEGQPLLVRGAAACTGLEACTWKQVSA